jgi:putative SOS response-associated peptidase YedK
MCGRYRRTTSEEELARRYHIPIPPQRDLPISWNIAPTQDVLAIRFNPEVKQQSKNLSATPKPNSETACYRKIQRQKGLISNN